MEIFMEPGTLFGIALAALATAVFQFLRVLLAFDERQHRQREVNKERLKANCPHVNHKCNGYELNLTLILSFIEVKVYFPLVRRKCSGDEQPKFKSLFTTHPDTYEYTCERCSLVLPNEDAVKLKIEHWQDINSNNCTLYRRKDRKTTGIWNKLYR